MRTGPLRYEEWDRVFAHVLRTLTRLGKRGGTGGYLLDHMQEERTLYDTLHLHPEDWWRIYVALCQRRDIVFERMDIRLEAYVSPLLLAGKKDILIVDGSGESPAWTVGRDWVTNRLRVFITTRTTAETVIEAPELVAAMGKLEQLGRIVYFRTQAAMRGWITARVEASMDCITYPSRVESFVVGLSGQRVDQGDGSILVTERGVFLVRDVGARMWDAHGLISNTVYYG